MQSSGSGDRAPGNQAAPAVSGPGQAAAAGPQARVADDWAICCSGGGIRSAAYCLGALQSLDQRGLLAKVKWILGVSGGSYIATSRALVAHDLPAGTEPHAYAPGTPEELNLRYNTRYIAPNGATVLVGVLSLLLGAMVTFVLVLAPLYALAHAWGWLLRWQGAAVPSGPHAISASVSTLAWWLPSVIAAGITLVLFGYWWLTLEPPGLRPSRRVHWWTSLKPDDRDRGANRATLVSWAATLTAGLALAMLAAPPLISWLTRSRGSFGTIAHFFGFGARPSFSLAAVAGLIAAVTDTEILSAQIRLANTEGLFAEPASAAPLALLFRLVMEGKIEKDSTTVVVLTGSGLKDPDAALKNVEPPIELDGDARTLAKVLKL